MKSWFMIGTASLMLAMVNWWGIFIWAEEGLLPGNEGVTQEIEAPTTIEKPQEPPLEENPSLPVVAPATDQGGGNSNPADISNQGSSEQQPDGVKESSPTNSAESPTATGGSPEVALSVSEETYSQNPDTSSEEPPAAPTGLTAAATGPNSVTLSWNGTTGENIVYQVYGAPGDGTFTWLKDVSTTVTAVNGLKPVTTYNFYVQLLVQGQVKSASNIVTVTTPVNTNPPRIISSLRKPAGSGVSRTQRVEVVWDDWLEPATINSKSFYVTVVNSSVKIPGRYSWDDTTRTMYFTPDQPWAQDTSYNVVINGNIKSTSGLAAGFTSWVFTTIKSPFISPHGTYLFSTAPCALCHSAHAATGKKLLTNLTIAELCLSCHDGSGSVIVFFDAPQMGHDLDSNCCACHNPHRPKP